MRRQSTPPEAARAIPRAGPSPNPVGGCAADPLFWPSATEMARSTHSACTGSRGGADRGAAGALGVRARIPSGSDETCELPLGPTWLRLKELRLDGRNPVPPNPDGFEVPLPEGEFEFELKLAAPVPDANVLEVDFVRRPAVTGAGGTETSE